MKEAVRFSPKIPGGCPAYMDYYIQDKPVGSDIYGHERYAYAVFRRCEFVEIVRFKKRKQAYKCLSALTGLSRWDVMRRSSAVLMNDRNALGVLHGNKLYKLNKRTNSIQTRPVEDERLTVWYDTYAECLEEGKRLVAEKLRRIDEYLQLHMDEAPKKEKG